jgi:hypothetical protein
VDNADGLANMRVDPPFGVDMGLMPIKAWLMHIWVFGAAALTAPEAAGRYHGQLHELSLLLSRSE